MFMRYLHLSNSGGGQDTIILLEMLLVCFLIFDEIHAKQGVRYAPNGTRIFSSKIFFLVAFVISSLKNKVIICKRIVRGFIFSFRELSYI